MHITNEDRTLALLMGFSDPLGIGYWANSNDWDIYHSPITETWRLGNQRNPAASNAVFPTFKAALEAYAAATGQADVQETLS